MAFTPGDYVGFSEEDYNSLAELDLEGLSDFLAECSKIDIDGITFYVFSGNEFDLLEFFENNDLTYDLQYFSYIKSTWSVSGF